jgi:hypothetical protein
MLFWCASFGLPLDTEPEEVDPLVKVADPGLGCRQAQAHRRQRGGCLVWERLGVRSGAADQHDPVVGVADQPNAGLPASPLGWWGRLAPGEVLVEHAQGDVGSSGDRMPPCGVPVIVSLTPPSWLRMPAFRNALTSTRTRLSAMR